MNLLDVLHRDPGPFVCLCGYQTDVEEVFVAHVAAVHHSDRYSAWRLP